jgi:RNA polymerase sigma factor (sigma-70 family)
VNAEPASLTDRSDEDLVRAGSAGDTACFEELVRRYMKAIFNFAYRMTGNYAEADDVAQDVFVQVYRSLPTMRTDLPFKAWLYVVARNKCLDVLKRKRALTFSAIEDPERGESPLDRLADPDPVPEQLFERADLQRVLREAIEQLPEKYRSVVAMRYASGLTFAEIGEALGLPENTVKTHFQRAKAALRQSLESVL